MWYITRRRVYRTLIAWGPVLAAMIVMFIASAQPKYGPPDDQTTAIYFSGVVPVFPGFLETLIKKSAHVVAFGGLALLALRALVLGEMNVRQSGYLAIVITVGYALLDELHQASTPGRTASGIDIGLDFIGAALAVLLARRYLAQPNDNDMTTKNAQAAKSG
jgi:VanZ family protein